jgi:hypothetical protein
MQRISAFTLGPKKPSENADRVGLSQNLSDVHGHLASIPASFKSENPNFSFIYTVAIFDTFRDLNHGGWFRVHPFG